MSKKPSVVFNLFKRNKKLATKKVKWLQKHPNLKYIKYPLLPNYVQLNLFRFQHASCRILSKERNFPERAPKHKFSPKTLDAVETDVRALNGSLPARNGVLGYGSYLCCPKNILFLHQCLYWWTIWR